MSFGAAPSTIPNLTGSIAAVLKEGRHAGRAFRRIAGRVPGYRDLLNRGLIRQGLIQNLETGENIYSRAGFAFSDALPELNLYQLRLVSQAAIFLLFHVLLSDDLMDEVAAAPPETMLVSNGFQALGWRILSKAAGHRPLPWSKLMGFYHQYLAAVYAENRHHRGKPQPYTTEELISIVSGRCAVSKIVAAVLFELGGRPEVSPRIERSLDYFWVTDCMQDDWKDWKGDLHHNRYSYLLTEAITGLGGVERLENLSLEMKWETLGKYILGSGFLQSYLDKMMEFCEMSRDACAGTGCERWRMFLDSRLAEISARRNNLVRATKSLELEYGRGRGELVLSAGAGVDAAPAGSLVRRLSSVCGAADRAATFLLNEHLRRDNFCGFITPFGRSNVLTAASIGLALDSWRQTGAIETSSADYDRAFSRITESILELRTSGGWSSAPLLPPDAETTAWALRYLAGRRYLSLSDIAQATSCLKGYQREEGGFGRFIPQSADPDFEAWAACHDDITGLVAGVIGRLSGDASPELQRASSYLLNRLDSRPLWQSYWWESVTYCAFLCLDGLSAAGHPPDTDRRQDMAAEVIGLQDRDGSWGDALRGRSTVFETAWAIRLLLRLDPAEDCERAILGGARWLLLHQLADGSWNSDPVLRVPSGKDRHPWNFDCWKLDAAAGCGCLLRDQQRLLTTSVALSALSDFVSCRGDYGLLCVSAVEVV